MKVEDGAQLFLGKRLDDAVLLLLAAVLLFLLVGCSESAETQASNTGDLESFLGTWYCDTGFERLEIYDTNVNFCDGALTSGYEYELDGGVLKVSNEAGTQIVLGEDGGLQVSGFVGTFYPEGDERGVYEEEGADVIARREADYEEVEANRAEWNSYDWQGGAGPEFLGRWNNDTWKTTLVVSEDALEIYSEDNDGSYSGMQTSYASVGDQLCFGTEYPGTWITLTDDGGLVLNTIEGVFYRDKAEIPLDLSQVTDIPSVADSDETKGIHGEALLCYGGGHLIADVTPDMTADEFLFSGPIVVHREGEELDEFRDFGYSGERGAFSYAELESGPDLLPILSAMGAITDGYEIVHSSIQFCAFSAFDAPKFFLLSQGEDGRIHIAALIYHPDTDTYQWDGEVRETSELCCFAADGTFCYREESGKMAGI